MQQQQDHFALENFEGPIDFLLYLIQKEEIDIYEVPIQDLIQQFINKLHEWNEKHLDRGAEFIGTAAYLVWLKSKMLLPKHEEEEEDDFLEMEEDPHFEIIHHLIDYCRFKQAAKDLIVRQDQQQFHYFRGLPPSEWKRPMGIDHVSLDDLADLFKTMIGRIATPIQHIHEENYRVSDKIRMIRHKLKEEISFAFENLFSSQHSRTELIVIFLAVLELMKLGEICVGREKETALLLIFVNNADNLGPL
jgi:segregation and condensation protein A